jgi:hypothetical protein
MSGSFHFNSMGNMKTLSAIAFALMLVASTALAQGNGVETNKYDLSINYYNPCCDEMVQITGTIHENFRVLDNGDGTMTITNHSSASNIKGAGSNGTKYVGSETTKAKQTIAPFPGPVSIDTKSYTKLIGTGKNGHTCSFTVRVTWHLRIDELGNVIVDDYDIEFDCDNDSDLF